jgi:hypothetical protein
MKSSLLYLTVVATISTVGCAEQGVHEGMASSKSKDSNFLSVHGKTSDDSSNQTTFWVTLQLGDHSWQAGEIGGTSNVFVTKQGVYVYQAANSGATLLESPDGTKNIASLVGLNPDTVQTGDTGRFYSDEQGRTGTWDLLAR